MTVAKLVDGVHGVLAHVCGGVVKLCVCVCGVMMDTCKRVTVGAWPEAADIVHMAKM